MDRFILIFIIECNCWFFLGIKAFVGLLMLHFELLIVSCIILDFIDLGVHGFDVDQLVLLQFLLSVIILVLNELCGHQLKLLLNLFLLKDHLVAAIGVHVFTFGTHRQNFQQHRIDCLITRILILILVFLCLVFNVCQVLNLNTLNRLSLRQHRKIWCLRLDDCFPNCFCFWHLFEVRENN